MYIIQINDIFAPPPFFFQNDIFAPKYSEYFLFSSSYPLYSLFSFLINHIFPLTSQTHIFAPGGGGQNEKYTPLQDIRPNELKVNYIIKNL